MSLESDSKIHITKAVSISSIIQIIIIVFGFGVVYADIKSDVTELEKDLQAGTKDRIHKSTVDKMFEIRDIKIIAVAEDVKEIKLNQKEFQTEQREAQKETQKMLIEIIRKLPKPQ